MVSEIGSVKFSCITKAELVPHLSAIANGSLDILFV